MHLYLTTRQKMHPKRTFLAHTSTFIGHGVSYKTHFWSRIYPQVIKMLTPLMYEQTLGCEKWSYFDNFRKTIPDWTKLLKTSQTS